MYEFTGLPEAIDKAQMMHAGSGDYPLAGGDNMEFKPHYHEWASVLPGMITVSKKNKTHSNHMAAETAVPVIACAACKSLKDENEYFFSGVARSKSVCLPDDGIGPRTDELFTLSLGGMVTVLNTSGGVVHAGDLVGWTFLNIRGRASNAKRAKTGPRRIAITTEEVGPSSDKIIGRALSFAKSGEPVDILLRP